MLKASDYKIRNILNHFVLLMTSDLYSLFLVILLGYVEQVIL